MMASTYRTDNSKITYTHTNESLEAIIAGLQISSEDAVVAVGGSGDQAFAMLEYAGRVKVFDKDNSQLEYIKRRAGALEKGNYNDFLPLPKITYDKSKCEQNRQFFLEYGRMERIRQKLPCLEIAEPGDIMELVQQEQGYSKAYLSNIIDWYFNRMDDNKIRSLLEVVANKLADRGLVYVANHITLIQLSEGLGKIHKSYLEVVHFLPGELEVNLELSLAARFLERRWSPAVYQKNRLKPQN